MSTEYKDPIADITNNWTKSTGTAGWDCINDAVREPSNPTVPGDYISTSTATQVEECTLGGPTTPPVRYGDAQVSVYAAGGTKRTITLQVFEGTTSRSSTVTVSAGAAAAWYHLPLTSMPTNWANLRIRMTCNTTGGSSATAVTVYEAYIRYLETETIVLGSSLSETDALYAITPYKLKRVVLASSIAETDAVYTLKRIKVKSFGTVSETELLYSITPQLFKPPKVVELSSSIAETDSIYALKNNPIRRLLKHIVSELKYGAGTYSTLLYGGGSSETDSIYTLTPIKEQGISALLNTIVETDTLNTIIVSPKRRLVSTINETDNVYALTPIKKQGLSALLNTIIETDAVYALKNNPIRRLLKRLVGGLAYDAYGDGLYGDGLYGGSLDTELSAYGEGTYSTSLYGGGSSDSETDRIYSITPQKSAVPQGIILASSIAETDSIYSIVAHKTKTLNTITEIDSVSTITHRKSRIFGTFTETGSISAISHRKSRIFGILTETDSVSTIIHRKSHVIGTFTETDSVSTITHLRSRTFGALVETDSVSTITHRKSRSFGTITETDSIYSFKINPRRRLVHTITETDSLWAISALGQKKINIGFVTETDTVYSIKINPQHRLLHTITESETVHRISPHKSRRFGTITEINYVYSITRFGVHYPSTRPGPNYLTLDSGKVSGLDLDENHDAFLVLIARTTSPGFTDRTTSPGLTVRTTYLTVNVNHLTGVIIDENHTGYLVLNGRETSPGLNAPNKELILDG